MSDCQEAGAQRQPRLRLARWIWPVAGLLALLVGASFFVFASNSPAQSPKPLTEKDQICSAARPMFDATVTGGTALSAFNISNFYGSPSLYATLWNLKLIDAGAGSSDVLSTVDRRKIGLFISGSVKDAGPSLGGSAASLTLAVDGFRTLALPIPTEILRMIDGLKVGGGYGNEPGSTEPALLASAELATSLKRSGATDASYAEKFLKSSLAEPAAGSEADRVETIGAQAAALLALRTMGSALPFPEDRLKAMIESWVAELAKDKISINVLPQLASIAEIAKSVAGLTLVTGPVDASIQPFGDGWVGAQGTVAPDPQLTYYFSRLVPPNPSLSLSSGLIEQGWATRSKPNLYASAFSSVIAKTCGLSMPATSDERREAFVTAVNDQSTQLSDLALWSLYAKSTGISTEAVKLSELSTRLQGIFESAGSQASFDQARALSVARRLGIATESWVQPARTEIPPSPLSGYLDFAAFYVSSQRADQEKLSPSSSSAYNSASVAPTAGDAKDLPSAVFSSLMSSANVDSPLDSLSGFYQDSKLCGARWNGSQCDKLDLMDVATAVTYVESAGEALDFIW